MEALADSEEGLREEEIPMLKVVRKAAERVEENLSPLSNDELTLATELIKGRAMVEVPGKWERHT